MTAERTVAVECAELRAQITAVLAEAGSAEVSTTERAGERQVVADLHAYAPAAALTYVTGRLRYVATLLDFDPHGRRARADADGALAAADELDQLTKTATTQLGGPA